MCQESVGEADDTPPWLPLLPSLSLARPGLHPRPSDKICISAEKQIDGGDVCLLEGGKPFRCSERNNNNNRKAGP